MAKYSVNDTSIAAVADVIRTKGGTSDAMAFPAGFVSAIAAIQAGGLKMATGTFTGGGSNASDSHTFLGFDFRPIAVFFFGPASFSIPFYGYGVEGETGQGRVSDGVKFNTQLSTAQGSCTLTGTKYAGGSQTMFPAYSAEITWFVFGE